MMLSSVQARHLMYLWLPVPFEHLRAPDIILCCRRPFPPAHPPPIPNPYGKDGSHFLKLRYFHRDVYSWLIASIFGQIWGLDTFMSSKGPYLPLPPPPTPSLPPKIHSNDIHAAVVPQQAVIGAPMKWLSGSTPPPPYAPILKLSEDSNMWKLNFSFSHC